MLQRQRIALRDLARRMMPSDGPCSLGDKVFVWMKDDSKKKAEGMWVRDKVVSQEGAMVLVQVHKSVLKVNQSKVRRDHDPWHDVAIPLNQEPAVKEDDAPEIHISMERQVIIVPAVMNTKSAITPTQRRGAILLKSQHPPQD